MATVDDPDYVPDVQRAVLAEIERCGRRRRQPRRAITLGILSRGVGECSGVVQVGDSEGYGCFLIRKGVI